MPDFTAWRKQRRLNKIEALSKRLYELDTYLHGLSDRVWPDEYDAAVRDYNYLRGRRDRLAQKEGLI